VSVRGLRHNIDHGQSHWNGLRSDAVHLGFTLSAETDQPTDVGCVGGQSARVSDRELSRNHDMRYTSESPCRTNGRLRDGPSMARKGMLRRATGGNASGSGSQTLDATCHDSIYCSQSRLDTLVGIEQYPVDMSPDVGYDPFDRCWETRALTAGPGRREIDVRGPGACGRVGPHVAAIVARRAAHRPSRCWVGARLRAGISLGSSRSATVRSRSSLAFPFRRFRIQRGSGRSELCCCRAQVPMRRL